MEKFWTRLNRVNLERRMIADKKKELSEDFCRLTNALRNFMGGINPQNYDLRNIGEDILVIPGSPIPYASNVSASPSLDTDDTGVFVK